MPGRVKYSTIMAGDPDTEFRRARSRVPAGRPGLMPTTHRVTATALTSTLVSGAWR
jgi:hypothetical protein